jgi:hypothetical protein
VVSVTPQPLYPQGNSPWYPWNRRLGGPQRLKYINLKFYLIFCMGVKLGLTLREEQRLNVFENRVFRRIPGHNREKVVGVWRRLHNEELRKLYASPDIIKVMKSMKMKWARHGRDEKCIQILKGRDRLKDSEVGRRIILEWILGK